MAEASTPVLDALVKMNEEIPERSGLDDETFMLVGARVASAGSSIAEAFGLAIAIADEAE